MRITKEHLKRIIKEELAIYESERSEAERMLNRTRNEPKDDLDPTRYQEQDGFYPDMSKKPERKKQHYAVSKGERIDLKNIFFAARQHVGMTTDGMLNKLNQMSSEFRRLPEWLKPMIVKYVKKNYIELY